MIVVSWCGGLAGVAAYKLANGTVCVVHEFALHVNLSCERDLVVNVALDALEATCLASGSYPIVVFRTDTRRLSSRGGVTQSSLNAVAAPGFRSTYRRGAPTRLATAHFAEFGIRSARLAVD